MKTQGRGGGQYAVVVGADGGGASHCGCDGLCLTTNVLYTSLTFWFSFMGLFVPILTLYFLDVFRLFTNFIFILTWVEIIDRY